MCALLLRHGAPVDARSKLAFTPLHNACREGHAATVHVLLEHHADLQAVTGFGSSPLHLAVKYGHFDLVKMLVRAGADVWAREVDGEGCLVHAQGTEMVDYLLNLGAY